MFGVQQYIKNFYQAAYSGYDSINKLEYKRKELKNIYEKVDPNEIVGIATDIKLFFRFLIIFINTKIYIRLCPKITRHHILVVNAAALYYFYEYERLPFDNNIKDIEYNKIIQESKPSRIGLSLLIYIVQPIILYFIIVTIINKLKDIRKDINTYNNKKKYIKIA